MSKKNWFESIFGWTLVNRSFESTFLLKNDPWSVIRIILSPMIRDPDYFITNDPWGAIRIIFLTIRPTPALSLSSGKLRRGRGREERENFFLPPLERRGRILFSSLSRLECWSQLESRERARERSREMKRTRSRRLSATSPARLEKRNERAGAAIDRRLCVCSQFRTPLVRFASALWQLAKRTRGVWVK